MPREASSEHDGGRFSPTNIQPSWQTLLMRDQMTGTYLPKLYQQ